MTELTSAQSAFLAARWPAPANVRAFATLRTGGVGRAPFDTFNLASHVGDDPHAVAENRRRLNMILHLPSDPAWLNQVHSNTVVEASQWPEPPSADASYTTSRGRVCCVLTADCLPVLFCSRQGDAVAAAHAGWRGLANGILDNTVRSFKCAPHDLLVWLGPAIGQASYEVGDDVRDVFINVDPNNNSTFVPNARGRWQCDLAELARRSLTRLGVHSIFAGGDCTFEDRARFFSFRRDGQCGRMATLIWLA